MGMVCETIKGAAEYAHENDKALIVTIFLGSFFMGAIGSVIGGAIFVGFFTALALAMDGMWDLIYTGAVFGTIGYLYYDYSHDGLFLVYSVPILVGFWIVFKIILRTCKK